ncbi:hypothetical protein KIN20_031082 [Parelaphostrongylus tenuis]|uniref:Uncharacterized protein n=1 Tax=Parelaphostrongylus tenuis TaxID=148309 RepID=A0AAD5WHC8_PARTN|nr:hypothetical protein KIN20_031082 [Parelaphostrongylus tenuis]
MGDYSEHYCKWARVTTVVIYALLHTCDPRLPATETQSKISDKSRESVTDIQTE